MRIHDLMKMEISEIKIREFQEKIFNWWKENKRDLPWRKTTNPYHIMVSEVMLQQTQVTRTIKKYLEFLQKFPTIDSLASASPAEVLTLWSGLGYNRRALWLQQAAQQIIEKGNFPETPEELEKLKGIGPYTARSILIFAMNEDCPTVDTNIRRILIAEELAEESTQEKELYKIAEKLIPKGKSRDWHNALMDYGSLELTAAKTGIKPKAKQKKFSKSKRYYRGKIVKILIKKQRQTKNQLLKECKVEEKEIDEILKSLVKDDLIVKRSDHYILPEK
ncbi:MAG: Fe-S cluster assembly protein HesB [Asgard group archaeon]|nr:Fe-S cluster assembly protein HesB [Asgard group archaeon]